MVSGGVGTRVLPPTKATFSLWAIPRGCPETALGEPGVKTLWRGWQRLHGIAATWKLVCTHSPPDVQPNFFKKDVSKA